MQYTLQATAARQFVICTERLNGTYQYETTVHYKNVLFSIQKSIKACFPKGNKYDDSVSIPLLIFRREKNLSLRFLGFRGSSRDV